VDNLPPRPFRYGPHRELFERYTGVTFDPIAPAVVASRLTVGMLLHAQRAARMVEQHAFDEGLPGLGQVIDRLVEATFDMQPADGYHAEINRAVERVVVEQLMGLAAEAEMPQVRAIAAHRLEQLRDRLARVARGDEADLAHYRAAAADIQRFLDRPMAPWSPPEPVEAPPGSPIGSGTPPGPPPR